MVYKLEPKTLQEMAMFGRLELLCFYASGTHELVNILVLLYVHP